MAFAAFAAPAMAQSAMVGNGGVDILGQGIFETGGSAFKFPGATDTNFDSIDVGSDTARAIGIGFTTQRGAFNDNTKAVTAQNNLKIKKNQDSGECACCQALDSSCPCQDCCIKYNVEQVKVGDRSATALGFGSLQTGIFNDNSISVLAQNNVEIVTNQQ
jgi:hypothetical protein